MVLAPRSSKGSKSESEIRQAYANIMDEVSRAQAHCIACRKHNDAGGVERKNSLVKDVLEKCNIFVEWKKRPFTDKLATVHFSSNVSHGEKDLSPFELLRNAPSFEASGLKWVSKELVAAQKEKIARKLLARILKSNFRHKKKREIKKSQRVLELVSRTKRRRG